MSPPSKKNNKTWHTVFIAGTLLLIGVIVFIIGLSSFNEFNLYDNQESNSNVNPGDQKKIVETDVEVKKKEYMKGTITEKNWESEYLNLRFTAPEGYTIEAEKESTSSIIVEMVVSVPNKTKLTLGLNDPSLSKITEEDYLKKIQQKRLYDKDRNYSVHDDITTVEIAGKNYKQLSFTVKTQGREVMQDFLVCKVDDRLVFMIISYNDKAQKENLLQAFTVF